ncbi:DUF2075 domain-containing protein [Pontibacter cellulosilyticus]|uniref:DUF2075 domain-containing protein n=1 Tax=Pontibacter cellulosilyticus TaxID=1720253 RepID=A0A923N4K5_9BACT|nr:DUF2075 domain-containing protein [Pontibacter cellulosilyticus]MBC5992428.1 DUF2075 domain-containing protein [Pontibacter cellulosilyticus]
MIVYKKTKSEFITDIDDFIIEDIIHESVQRKLNKRVGESEYKSWQNSLQYMANVLRTDMIPGDAGVAIEYNIPRTSNRIDFIVSGQSVNGEEHAVLIELKQWSEVQLTGKDAMVRTRFKHGMSEELHPSYQAWSYSALLNGFNQTVYEENIQLKPCAYLHNYTDDGLITNAFYSDYIAKAPVFCKEDKLKLRDFISSFIKHGDKKDLILRIENGKIKPSKNLADSMVSMIKGNQEFVMIDTQKIVYENALALAKSSAPSKKNVLIVKGGPGTGKSVVAINLLVALTKKGLLTQYVTRNSAPRVVYETKLTGTLKKTEISNFFSGSGAFTESASNRFDALIVDEAHRLNEKSGMFQNLGENQIKEIIYSSKFSVFFLDENQKVTLKDVGSEEEIERWATYHNATVHKLELTSQFRCGGSDGYLAWLDDVLQIRETANTVLDHKDGYDFRIFDNPNDLRDIIYKKNKEANKARIVAGYCWDWTSKKHPNAMDIVIPEHDFAMQWNMVDDGMLWIVKPETVSEVGCIHTCQGLEVDYIGVIIGDDLVCRDGEVIVDPTKRSRMDKSVHGYKKLLKENKEETMSRLTDIVKNTYRTLMSRGMKGCYVYFTDKETEEYFRSRVLQYQQQESI